MFSLFLIFSLCYELRIFLSILCSEESKKFIFFFYRHIIYTLSPGIYIYIYIFIYIYINIYRCMYTCILYIYIYIYIYTHLVHVIIHVILRLMSVILDHMQKQKVMEVNEKSAWNGFNLGIGSDQVVLMSQVSLSRSIRYHSIKRNSSLNH